MCLKENGFNWKDYEVLDTSNGEKRTVRRLGNARGSVQSPLVVLIKKCEKEAAFFYGKSRNWRQVTVYNETSTNIEVETDCAEIRKRTG